MNITIRHIEPTMSEPEIWLGTPPVEADNLWEEETIHGDFGSGRMTGRGRRLWAAMAVAAIVASVGFLGRFATDERGAPTTGSTLGRASMASEVALPYSIVSPALDARISGAVVEVRGDTTESAGTIHLGLVVGEAVIGWTTVRIDRPGPWSASMPVFAPPVTVEAELLASTLEPGAVAPRTALQMRRAAQVERSFTLLSNGPIAFWPATTDRASASTHIRVTGCAPLVIGSVTVAVAGPDGRRLASQAARVVVDDSLSGSVGGHALGLGSFAATLTLDGSTRDGALRVMVDWRDVVGGEWGTAVLTVTGPDASEPVGSPSP